jgi:hypothetical protein
MMTYDLPADPPSHVQASIESICELGCDRVNEIIDALECGNSVEETNRLDKTDQQWVLLELKAIMAIYDSNQV